MGLSRKFIIVGLAVLGAAVPVAAPVAAAAPVPTGRSDGTVQRAGGSTAVPGSYLVIFKDEPAGAARLDAARVGALAADLAGAHGGTVTRSYRSALRGAELRVDAQAAARIAAHPSVGYVEQNHTVSITGTQPDPPSWGLDRIDQRDLPVDRSYRYPGDASGVHAYIIDTGVRLTHDDFGGRAVTGYDTIGGGPGDCNGHGTHVAGTVGGSAHGVAKAARIVAVRVLDCAGSGTTAGVIDGVDWVTENAVRPAVANMSLGGNPSAALDTAVRYSINSGVTYGLAAGNDDGSDACAGSPGRTAEGITVGATTSTDTRSSFSNIGSCVDLFAPGSSITSTWFTDDGATNTISGTSMATPHVVGAAALVLAANPSWSPRQVRDALVGDATPGVVGDAGSGSPNRLLHVVGSAAPPTDDFSMTVTPTSGATAPGGSVTATVSTVTTGGAVQPVRLTADGLPAGATASFDPPSVTSGGSATLTVSTSADTPAGGHPLTLTGTGAGGVRTDTFTLVVTEAGRDCSGGNGGDLAIPDAGAAVTSGTSIDGCGRTGSGAAKVAVKIAHSYRGDLVIDLLAPDGSAYRLKSNSSGDSADHVDTTYTADLSDEPTDGTWRLRVRDVYSGDVGYLDRWTLTL